VPPEALLGLHVSSNGLAFAPDGSLYIALYGNNPGEVSAGHQVIRVPISADGVVSGPHEVVVDGGSPLDVAFGPAGLYVADFSANTITLVPQ
jgi:DNA-binding beta-propeller fold protein YncE